MFTFSFAAHVKILGEAQLTDHRGDAARSSTRARRGACFVSFDAQHVLRECVM